MFPLLIATALLALAAVSLARAAYKPPVRTHLTTRGAICTVFGRYCSQALRVVACESGFSTTARNGQFMGLFQMGSYARSRYGHSSSAYGQAQAAYRYFVDSGRDWSPWECKPW